MTKVVRDSDGMKILGLLKGLHNDNYVPKNKKLIRTFGVIDHKGFPSLIHWVVSDRKDMRHGVIGRKGKLGHYQLDLFNEMFRKW